jgi:hypothetical protein
MPRAGGQSTVHGVSYETWAVVRELVDVLEEINESVTPQAWSSALMPGEAGVPVSVDDYIVVGRGEREYHQAKHSAPRGGSWTVRRLMAAGVLDQFARQHCDDPGALLVLTSQSASQFLDDICDRAASSPSLEEFKRNRLTRTLLPEWTTALDLLRVQEGELFSLCRATRREALVSEEVRRFVEGWARKRFPHPPVVPSLLFDLAVEAARHGRTLTKRDILTWLAGRDTYLCTPLSTGDLLGAVREAGSSLREYPHEIAGVHLDRREVHDLVHWALAEDHEQKLAMLLDISGGGKTVILRDVLVGLEEVGMPVLAIKADLLSGAGSRKDLKQKLQLPATVERVMSQLTEGGRAVAILDQLDALSLTLSRDQATLDLMLDIVSRLRGIPSARVIASCRTFDLNTDPKLAQIKIDKRVSPEPLTHAQVARVLEAAGLEGGVLLPSLRQLLTIPQKLRVFVRVVQARRANLRESDRQVLAGVGGFTSLQDLYGELWRQSIEFPSPGAPTARERATVVNVLVEYMHQNRRVSAPEPLLASHVRAARYLEREDVLRRDGNVWVFSHQTLYDYCYARRFVAQGHSLHESILASDQGLFVRSEMVQVLTYLRGVDFQGYLGQLESLLFGTDPRSHLGSGLLQWLGTPSGPSNRGAGRALCYHLRLLLLQWFGSLADPRRDELPTAARLLRDDTARSDFLRGLMANEAWFDLLEERLLDELLAGDQATTRGVAEYLESVANARTDPVLERLEPHLGASESWDECAWACLARVEDWTNARAVEAVTSLLACGSVETWRRQQCTANIAQREPATGCRVLRLYLDRRVRDLLATTADGRGMLDLNANQILPPESEDYSFWEAVDQLAGRQPRAFVREFMPWVVDLAEHLARPEGTGIYAPDSLFSWLWHGQHLSEGGRLIQACRVALELIAKEDHEYFLPIAHRLAQSRLYAMHRLLVHGFLADPEAYAEDIYRYLVADNRALHLGDLDSPHYDSHQLIRAVFPHLAAEQRAKLESVVLKYQSRSEKTSLGAWGFGQLQLLKAMPPALLSRKARLRLLELERKFPGAQLQVPHGITGGVVTAPVPREARERMNDDAWVGAMRRYGDSTEWAGFGREFLKGGVVELSRAFADHAKAEPERFCKLALRLDHSISRRYVAAAIRGLAESEAPLECLGHLVRRFATEADTRVRKEICEALSRRAEDGVPEDLLETLGDYAARDPDPKEELGSLAGLDGQSACLGDPYAEGINTVRGIAIESLSRCALARRPPSVQVALNALQRAVNDSSTAVRACAVASLVGLLPHEPNRAVGLFETALDGREVLLDCQPTQRFLYHVYQSYFPRVRRFIEAMMVRQREATRQSGAVLACLASLASPDAGDLAESALRGGAALRLGAAQVYARNLENGRLEQQCLARLGRLLDDDDTQVRESIGNCFRYLRAEHLSRLRNFIQRFLQSRSLREGAYHLIQYLKPHVSLERQLGLDAVEGVLRVFGREVCDARTAAALMQKDLVQIALTVYAHSPEASERERAMDLFEQLLAKGSPAALAALREYDRQ